MLTLILALVCECMCVRKCCCWHFLVLFFFLTFLWWISRRRKINHFAYGPKIAEISACRFFCFFGAVVKNWKCYQEKKREKNVLQSLLLLLKARIHTRLCAHTHTHTSTGAKEKSKGKRIKVKVKKYATKKVAAAATKNTQKPPTRHLPPPKLFTTPPLFGFRFFLFWDFLSSEDSL